jgi:hypothetical protein
MYFIRQAIASGVIVVLTWFSSMLTNGDFDFIQSPTTTSVVEISADAFSTIPPASPTTIESQTTTPMPSVPAGDVAAQRVEDRKRCPEWESAFEAAGLPADIFSFIAWRESRCQPTAYNDTLNRDGSRDYGLLQINSTWKKVTSKICGRPWGQLDILFDPGCNIAVAKYLYDNGGLGHWSL